MIPKTEIRYSNIYNKKFNSEFCIKDLEKLKYDCKKFEVLYKKYINTLLRLIEKNHSKKWKYDFIPIYIVTGDTTSFSDPLTLRYKKNPKFMFIILAHELLHNNIFGRFKDSKQIHKYMEPILNKIIKEFPMDLDYELKFFNRRLWENLK